MVFMSTTINPASTEQKTVLVQLRRQFRANNGLMNGSEIISAYNTFFPTNGPLTIPFTEAYRALYELAVGHFPDRRPLRHRWSR